MTDFAQSRSLASVAAAIVGSLFAGTVLAVDGTSVSPPPYTGPTVQSAVAPNNATNGGNGGNATIVINTNINSALPIVDDATATAGNGAAGATNGSPSGNGGTASATTDTTNTGGSVSQSRTTSTGGNGGNGNGSGAAGSGGVATATSTANASNIAGNAIASASATSTGGSGGNQGNQINALSGAGGAATSTATATSTGVVDALLDGNAALASAVSDGGNAGQLTAGTGGAAGGAAIATSSVNGPVSNVSTEGSILASSFASGGTGYTLSANGAATATATATQIGGAAYKATAFTSVPHSGVTSTPYDAQSYAGVGGFSFSFMPVTGQETIATAIANPHSQETDYWKALPGIGMETGAENIDKMLGVAHLGAVSTVGEFDDDITATVTFNIAASEVTGPLYLSTFDPVALTEIPHELDPEGIAKLSVAVNGNEVLSTTVTNANYNDLYGQTLLGNFTPVAGGYEVVISLTLNSGMEGDEVAVSALLGTAVPEPTSFAVVAASGSMLLMRRRRA